MEESRFKKWCFGAIVLLSIMVYANTFNGDWVWDDASSVLLHKHVQDPGKLTQLFKEDQHAFGQGQGNFYRPLLSVTFMIDFLLSHDPVVDGVEKGLPVIKPFVFHLSSMIWHCAAALLLFAFMSRCGAPQWVRAAVPLLWVVHPLHTEAVAYISGRADMMSGAFIFGGLSLALCPTDNRKHILLWGLALLCFISGLLSKESAMIFPALLFLCLLLGAGRTKDAPKSGYRWVPLLLSGIVLGGYGYLRSSVLSFADSTAATSPPFVERLFETGQAFAFYLKVLFIPTHLHMEQSLVGVPDWTAWLGFAGIAFFILLFIVAWRAKQHRLALASGWFLLSWLPISGLFPLNAPMAEHWMYVPMAGFWWALAEIAVLLGENKPVVYLRTAAVYGLCVLFVVLSIQRNADWDSNERLFRSTIAENPNSMRVHHNLAVSYSDILKNEAGAQRHYQRVLDLQGPVQSGRMSLQQVDVYSSLGRSYFAQKNYAKALYYFAPLTTIQPDSDQNKSTVYEAAYNSGLSMLALGDLNLASRYFGLVEQLAPQMKPNIKALMLGAPL